MSPKLKVLQVIPKLGYGGAETGCYDLAHYLTENNYPFLLFNHWYDNKVLPFLLYICFYIIIF